MARTLHCVTCNSTVACRLTAPALEWMDRHHGHMVTMHDHDEKREPQGFTSEDHHGSVDVIRPARVNKRKWEGRPVRIMVDTIEESFRITVWRRGYMLLQSMWFPDAPRAMKDAHALWRSRVRLLAERRCDHAR